MIQFSKQIPPFLFPKVLLGLVASLVASLIASLVTNWVPWAWGNLSTVKRRHSRKFLRIPARSNLENNGIYPVEFYFPVCRVGEILTTGSIGSGSTPCKFEIIAN